MTLVDTNILLYLANREAPQHERVAKWTEQLFASRENVGLPWPTIWGFLRISTNIRLWPRSTASAAEAFAHIREWLTQPGVTVVTPGPRHAELLEHLVTQYAASGPLVSDAVLAAIALEHGATLASTDRDFSRFPDLKWVNPLE